MKSHRVNHCNIVKKNTENISHSLYSQTGEAPLSRVGGQETLFEWDNARMNRILQANWHRLFLTTVGYRRDPRAHDLRHKKTNTWRLTVRRVTSYTTLTITKSVHTSLLLIIRMTKYGNIRLLTLRGIMKWAGDEISEMIIILFTYSWIMIIILFVPMIGAVPIAEWS